jgi:hypothetical protein
MSPEDAHKLLGGYATGTLTAEEQQALFEAALQDQGLFDALAREQALRDVLGDAAARAQLLAAIDDVPAPWYRRFWRPLPMAALAAGLALVTITAVWQASQAPRPLPLAKFTPPPRRAVETPAPILPPPPELAQARPVLPPVTLPADVPSAAPLPLLQEAPKSKEALRVPALDGGLVPAQGFRRNSMFAQVNGPNPLHGTVTDPSGAAIASATVEIKSLATGAVVKTATDERGEFNTAGVSGLPFQISASAAGFQTTTMSNLTPAPGAPVNLRLEPGAVVEAVGVTGVASGGGGARTAVGGVARPMASAAVQARPPAPPVLQYRVMRQASGGSPVELPAGGTVAAGATLILQITPGADGNVLISESGGRVIANRAVQAAQRLDIPLPTFDKPGPVELRVLFSRTPLEEGTAGLAVAQQNAVTLIVTLNIQ